MQLSEYQAHTLQAFLGNNWSDFVAYLEGQQGLDPKEAVELADEIYAQLQV